MHLPRLRRRTFLKGAALSAIVCGLATLVAADNELTGEEREAGWKLLFDGKTLDGWKTSGLKPSKRPVEDASINPHLCGDYMMVHETEWSDFVLSLDFKISKGCNSGIFVRTSPLTPRPGKDVGYNGIEVAIDDTRTADFHDTGALYDLVKPSRNAMKPPEEWNHAVITCDRSLITVELNGEKVTRMDLEEWTEISRRPDGTEHKFDVAYRDHARCGYIGLQDHGSRCWFKNIKLKPLVRSRLGQSKGDTLRILPVGDSIADGGSTGGYRYPLQNLLKMDGYKFRFLGAMSGPDDKAHDPHHDGRGGWEINSFPCHDDDGGQRCVEWKKLQPDLILLLIGSSDMNRSVDPKGAPSRLALLVDAILSDCPNTQLIVTQIPPLGDAAAEERAKAFNAAIPELVRVRAGAGKLISLVDLHAALAAGDLADGTHPNAAGYEKIARAWMEAIRAVAR